MLILALLACSQPEPPPVDIEPPPPSALEIDPPAAPGASSPSLARDSRGVLAVWLEPAFEGASRVVTSRWSVDGWSRPETVAAGPQVVAGWADHPDIVRGGDGARVVSWLQGDPADPGATEVVVSREAGGAWRSLGVVHSDGVSAEHGFSALARVGSSTQLYWLDGRHAPEGGPTELRRTVITDAVGSEQLVDPVVCDCYRVDAQGDIVAYRDRADGDVRDITVRRGDQVTTFADGWVAEGCPVNGPAVDAVDDRVAVAWYTEAPTPRVQVAFSLDGTATFTEPVRVDAGAPDGRVDVAVISGQAVVAWSEGGALHLRRIDARGKLGADVTVGPITQGFPALSSSDDELLLLWQQPGEAPTLTARLVPLAVLPSDGPTTALTTTQRVEVIGAPFPQGYVSRDLDDEPVPFAQWAGQPVLVNLWATWCPPCMKELPALQQIHQTWAPKGLVMLGIAVEDQVPKVRATVTSRGMAWTMLQDGSRPAGAAFGSTMLPTTLVYGRDGTLLYLHTGAVTEDDPDLLAALATAVGG